MQSNQGFVMTILFFTLIVGFFCSNVEKLVNRLDANITQLETPLFFDNTKKFSIDPKNMSEGLEKSKFKIAWAVQHYTTREFKDDPDYLTWRVHLSLHFKGNTETKQIPLKWHRCTEEDFQDFYTPSVNFEERFLNYRESKKFFCIDPIEE